jgi:uncharacterized membrane protein (UPF0127 family)
MYRENDGQCVVPSVWRATRAWERMRGLLGRPALAVGEGMLIDRCGMVHTLGMRYPLDLVFLDGGGRVRKTVAGVAPARLSGSLGASLTLELAPGGLAAAGVRPGDRLVWREQQ